MTGSLFFALTLKITQNSYLRLNRGGVFLIHKTAGKVVLEILKQGAGVETYLTANEVADFLRLSEQTIRRYTMKKEIPFHKIGRAVRYKKSEIEQWVEKLEVSSGEENSEEIDGCIAVLKKD